MKVRLSSLAAGLAAIGLLACGPSVEHSQRDEPGLFGSGSEVAPWHASVARARTVTIQQDVTRGEQSPDAERSPAHLHLELFDDVHVDAELTALRRLPWGHVWVGSVPAEPQDEVLLSVSDGRYAGTIRSRGRLYQLLPSPEGHLLIERSEADIPDEVPPIEPELDVDASAHAEPASGPVHIDVMVAYTSQALAGAGSEAGMAALIDLAVAETNEGYLNSDVDIELRLVGSVETAYDESGFDWNATLVRLSGHGDGYMDELHAKRDELGADHVVLLVNTVGPYAGLGYLMTSALAPFFDGYAFSVVAREYATGAYTFGHELGHNMGSHHDVDNAVGSGFFPYSHGLQRFEQGYRTVMSYNCDQGFCPRVNQWSNPNIAVNGIDSGIAEVADNASSLNGTAAICAQFRDAPIVEIEAASLLTPENGALLPSESVRFEWTDVGAPEYRLSVGIHAGDDSHYDVSLGQDTAVDAVGLPEDGSTLFARLWTRGFDDVWLYNDYTFTAHSQSFEGAQLIHPAPGSVLPSTSVVLSWSAGNAERFKLQIGDDDDPVRFYDGRRSRLRRAWVTGLPHDGRRIIARLWSRDEQGWSFVDSEYIAHTAPSYAAQIVYPNPGTPLFASATFRWTLTEASAHWLVLTSGSQLLAAVDAGAADGATIDGLPGDGRRIVATLYSEGVDGWSDTAAVFGAPPLH